MLRENQKVGASIAWINRFLNHPDYSGSRLKVIDTGIPRLEISDNIVDKVDLSIFIKYEPKRIPLVIGTQFGIYPNIWMMDDFFAEKRDLGILSKSLLSGNVHSLTLFHFSGNISELDFLSNMDDYKTEYFINK